VVKYSEIKATWTSPAAPSENMYLDRIYSILRKNGKLYVTDGNADIEFDEFCITHFLSPNNDIQWNEVDFTDEVKESKIFKTK